MEGEAKKSKAALRKDVYDFLERNGFRMNEKQQHELSDILKSVYENRVSDLNPTVPLKHEIVCPQCQKIKVMKRTGYKSYKKGIRKAGGIV